MTAQQAVTILWGQEIKTTEQIYEELELIRKRKLAEEEIDNAAMREGGAIREMKVRRSRIKKYRG
jgi:hypothetical protein